MAIRSRALARFRARRHSGYTYDAIRADSLSNLGSSLVVSHDYAGAPKVLALYGAKLGNNDRHSAYVMSELGVIAERTGKLDDALARIRQAEAIAVTVQGADHPDLADYLSREGSVLTAMKRSSKPSPSWFARSRSIATRTAPKRSRCSNVR